MEICLVELSSLITPPKPGIKRPGINMLSGVVSSEEVILY
jgi:hypothetical protein